jgi:hypothetical protein
MVRSTPPDIQARQGWIDWLHEARWTFAVTLTARPSAYNSFYSFNKELHRWHARLQKLTSDPVRCFLVMEPGIEGHIHAHGVISAPSMSDQQIRKEWKAGAQAKVEVLGSLGRDPNYWYRYMLKNLTMRHDTTEEVLLGPR